MLSIHQIVFTKIFSFLFLPSNLFKSRCQIKESLYGLRIHGRYHIHITVHMTLFSVLPEELDPVGGGVEAGRQGLGAVPSAHQLLAHHLSALRLHPAARFASPGVQI